MLIDVPLLKHQLAFVSDVQTRYIGLCAGYGSGKTRAFCMKAIVLASQNIKFKGALLEPTNVMVRDVLIPMMNEVLDDLGLQYTFSQSPLPQYVIHFAQGDCTILLRSAQNWRRLVGLNLAFFGVDESDTLKPEVAHQMWNQLMSRLRSGNVYQGFTTSTPEGFKWLHRFFCKEATGKTDRRLIKARTQDNPFLPKEYIASLLENYPSHLIEAYLGGNFVNLQNATVYGCFDREKSHTNLTFQDFPNHVIHVGQDFNRGKMSSALGVVDKGVVYVLGEIANGLNTQDIIDKLKRRFPNRKIVVYPDASGATKTGISDTTMFEDNGMKCYHRNSNPLISDRVNAVNRMLCDGLGVRRMFINANECPEIVSCFEGQTYVDGKPDKSSGFDHMMDGLGYWVYYLFPIGMRNKLTMR